MPASTSAAADAACSTCPTMRSCATRSGPCSQCFALRAMSSPSAADHAATRRLALAVSPQGTARRALRARTVRGAGRVSRAGSQPRRGHHRLRGARRSARPARDAVARARGIARGQGQDSADRGRGGGRRHRHSSFAIWIRSRRTTSRRSRRSRFEHGIGVWLQPGGVGHRPAVHPFEIAAALLGSTTAPFA